MNSKKQTGILSEADLGSHHTSKMKVSVKNNTSLLNKTVTENDEILETERGNSSPSSKSK